MNEFSENDKRFYGAFPLRFFLGEGMPCKGTPSPRLVCHWFRQWRQDFAKDIVFVLSTGEQIVRHETIRHAKAKAIPGKNGNFAEICTLANSPGFQDMLQRAVDHPTTKEARALNSKLENLVTLGSSRVRWSAAQRKALISTIYSYTNFFGTYVTCTPVRVGCLS
jgi:hypothetical protein